MATLWCAWGETYRRVDVDQLLEVARRATATSKALHAGVTQVQPRVVVLRALGHHRETVWTLLREVRHAWRQLLWSVPPNEPRVWSG